MDLPPGIDYLQRGAPGHPGREVRGKAGSAPESEGKPW